MEHLMIDLETLGHKTNGSTILSVGAVEFDIETGKTGKELYLPIDPQDCINHGLLPTASTISWWMKQDDHAQFMAFEKDKVRLTLLEALNALKSFCDGKDYRVWGNSARFDLGILSAAYDVFNRELPWNHWAELDVRTMVFLNPDVKKNMKFEGIQHDPIADCKHQIKYISEIWKSLN